MSTATITLADLVRERGRLQAVEVAYVLRGVARALSYCHDRGVSHGELTPQNIVVVRAEASSWRIDVVNAAVSGPMEMSVAVWSAPEVLRSIAEAPPSADVWSVALGAFWLLTGRVFWKAGRLLDLVCEVIDGPMPRASQRAAELGVESTLPPGFDEWFMMATDLRPERRFFTARAAAAAFAGLVGVVSAPAVAA